MEVHWSFGVEDGEGSLGSYPVFDSQEGFLSGFPPYKRGRFLGEHGERFRQIREFRDEWGVVVGGAHEPLYPFEGSRRGVVGNCLSI